MRLQHLAFTHQRHVEQLALVPQFLERRCDAALKTRPVEAEPVWSHLTDCEDCLG